jgi:hypothetical protein
MFASLADRRRQPQDVFDDSQWVYLSLDQSQENRTRTLPIAPWYVKPVLKVADYLSSRGPLKLQVNDVELNENSGRLEVAIDSRR